MPLYGIIGFPLQHSFSRPYFLEKFNRENIAGCDYQVFPLQHIHEFPGLLQQYPNLAGLNVTIPHKQSVLQYVHETDAVVKACGAANCLRIRNGRVAAFNTDVTGFRQSLQPLLQPEHDRALIFGTGGAAKAVAYVFRQLGIAYAFVSRSAGNLPNTLTYAAVTREMLQQYRLLVNATPAGMEPDITGFPPIDYTALTPQHLLYDLVYNPAKTRFLQLGEEKGAVIKNGYEMLVRQAEAGWAIWNA